MSSADAEPLLPLSRTSLTVNGFTEHQIMSHSSQIQDLVQRQREAWLTGNIDHIIADFAEDCLFVVSASRLQGKQEVKQSAEDFFASHSVVSIEIHRLIENGNQGAVEWSWSEMNHKTGESSKAEDAIIFSVENGKINYWREYIDKLD